MWCYVTNNQKVPNIGTVFWVTVSAWGLTSLLKQSRDKRGLQALPIISQSAMTERLISPCLWGQEHCVACGTWVFTDLSQNQDHIWAVIAMDIPAKLVLTSRSGKGFATPRWYFYGLVAYLIIHPLAVSFYFYTYIYIVSLNHCAEGCLSRTCRWWGAPLWTCSKSWETDQHLQT